MKIEYKQPTSIRLNETLMKRIKKEADEEKRSVSKQIEFILEKYYEIIDIAKPKQYNELTEKHYLQQEKQK